ncbi:hypothetical protein RIF29_27435 [Crotalaria pallida]|uniref:Uncharacterized protein n=1 Tax=Crotalaria pallida TaxID=3830 RepID=A0AAN9I5K5_CROPI
MQIMKDIAAFFSIVSGCGQRSNIVGKIVEIVGLATIHSEIGSAHQLLDKMPVKLNVVYSENKERRNKNGNATFLTG